MIVLRKVSIFSRINIFNDSLEEFQDKYNSEEEHDSYSVSSDSENESKNINASGPESHVTDDELASFMIMIPTYVWTVKTIK